MESFKKLPWAVVLACLLAVTPWVSVPFASAAAVISNDDCLNCHADKDLFKKTPDGKKISLYTDKKVFSASVHQKLDCVGCHQDIKDIPHAETLAKVNCGACHQKAQGTYTQSAHFQHFLKGKQDASCRGCHGKHDIRPAKKITIDSCRNCHSKTYNTYMTSFHGQAFKKGSPDAPSCYDCHERGHSILSSKNPKALTYHLNIPRTCARCHADPKLVKKHDINIPTPFTAYEKSIHGKGALKLGLTVSAVCTDCHGVHDLYPAKDPRSPINRYNIAKTCSKCHQGVYEVYEGSIHGKAVKRGVSDSPTCTDCHGEHGILGPKEKESSVYATAISKTTCPRCHGATRITEKYGLAAARLSTYVDSYHGLADKAGNKVVANCASCHSIHDIRASDDPLSTVNPKNLPHTCGKCHPGASDNFAKGTIHLAASPEQEPIVYWVQQFYIMLIIGTIGGMLVHNGLDFYHKVRAIMHRKSKGIMHPLNAERLQHATLVESFKTKSILRLTVEERLQHAGLVISFVVLVITGFALKFPDAFWVTPLMKFEQTFAWRSNLHRAAAVVMVLACLYHLYYMLFTPRGRQQLWAVMPRFKDYLDTVHMIKYYFGLVKDRPKFDRFNYIEKSEYWALVWGSVVMAVTGFALWFENVALRYMSKWMLDVATVIHYYEAWLATLAIIVWHLYYVIYNPDVYPMNWTWLTGEISVEEMLHEHPLELERLHEEGLVERKGSSEPKGH